MSAAEELKKRELLDQVLERSGVKKKYAKPVVEAMIELLGEAVADGRALNLEPLGKVIPQRVKDAGKHRVVVARIRQNKKDPSSESDPEQPVAAVAE